MSLEQKIASVLAGVMMGVFLDLCVFSFLGITLWPAQAESPEEKTIPDRAEIVETDLLMILREAQVESLEVIEDDASRGWYTLHGYLENGVGVTLSMINNRSGADYRCYGPSVYFKIGEDQIRATPEMTVFLDEDGLKRAKERGTDRIYIDQGGKFALTERQLECIKYISGGGLIYTEPVEEIVYDETTDEFYYQDSRKRVPLTYVEDSMNYDGPAEVL